jgi:hypothetical protein
LSRPEDAGHGLAAAERRERVYDRCRFDTGAILAANPAPGDEILVANLGANALLVYPPLGGNDPGRLDQRRVQRGDGKTAKFIARTGSLNFIALLSA